MQSISSAYQCLENQKSEDQGLHLTDETHSRQLHTLCLCNIPSNLMIGNEHDYGVPISCQKEGPSYTEILNILLIN
ncbi:hypothetical protein EUGRSUZ_I00652 [Eucalyptus grandis]|uniref:Uncharacterized protein n=2 Tax=Eucalyptus grandis TaxID=71139 RepID=A0ACC3JDA5_EUCGR|nr:hypothetical protein EUGRSUZ_I00652 [Eucalyptus grandis]